MMAAVVCQPLTAGPPNLARERPVKIAYTSVMTLQQLATHSTLASSAPASTRISGARTMQSGQYAWTQP